MIEMITMILAIVLIAMVMLLAVLCMLYFKSKNKKRINFRKAVDK